MRRLRPTFGSPLKFPGLKTWLNPVPPTLQHRHCKNYNSGILHTDKLGWSRYRVRSGARSLTGFWQLLRIREPCLSRMMLHFHLFKHTKDFLHTGSRILKIVKMDGLKGLFLTSASIGQRSIRSFNIMARCRPIRVLVYARAVSRSA